jgi:hypothetical protein
LIDLSLAVTSITLLTQAIWDFDDDNILLAKHPQYLLPGLGKDTTSIK